MSDPTTIRILESDNNRKGDLFSRLMADLFVALGYEQPRFHLQKTGRELDLSTPHRLENRWAIAECKATTHPIGGGDLNKFVGALDAERDDSSLTGYFISLHGFTETAILQESKRRTKIILLDGQQVASELVKGRIVIPWDKATELAGRYCGLCEGLVLDSTGELLAHERGWIWAVYYLQRKLRTHFALIHSDGTPLANAVANEVIRADRDCGGELHKLNCLNPTPLYGTDADIAEALAAYRHYLNNECGFIQLDGLPADTDIGSRRLKLENLFVPLHVDIAMEAHDGVKKLERQKIGEALGQCQRLALLAAPGGGKSTLVKRLAVAYVDSARRKQIADDLPEHDWFPLFFRCRELRDLARGSFNDLLQALAEREPVRQHARAFRALIDRALLDGRVLLLVDGLDEIADAGDRAAFVCTLRSAVQAYPKTALLVTSREAGFRHVAAHLASLCAVCNLSPFNDDDICRLCVAWHTEVIGATEKVRADAESLAETVVKNDRIRRLAINPLLLTTLLLVKRWVGALPTRRAALYGKAVEVLLMTWNTEGHKPIPEDEALPQLCYVASAMMLEGVQKISKQRLAFLIQESRTALPAELGYVQETVTEFINRIEHRSSLLMMSGFDVEDGKFVEFFEFRHLTFQEFLTARAIIEGWHQGRREEDTLVTVLSGHFQDERWREVIPLAAVLGGKATDALIQSLTEQAERVYSGVWLGQAKNLILNGLGHSLADEAPARPQTIREAICQLVRFGAELFSAWSFTSSLARGRYGKVFLEEAEKNYLDPKGDFTNARYALLSVVWWQSIPENHESLESLENVFFKLSQSSHSVYRCEGVLGYVGLIELDRTFRKRNAQWFSRLLPALIRMLFSKSLPEEHASLWLLARASAQESLPLPLEPDVLGRLFEISVQSSSRENRDLAAQTFANQPLLSRGSLACRSVSLRKLRIQIEKYETLLETADAPEKTVVLVTAWYCRAISDTDLLAFVRELIPLKRGQQTILTNLHKVLLESSVANITSRYVDR